MQKQSQPPSRPFALNAQLLQKELTREPEENVWLSEQFDRLPYRLYRYWLVLSFVMALTIIPLSAWIIWDLVKDFSQSWTFDFGQFIIRFTLLIMTCMLILFGSGEMLSAIKTKKSKLTQNAFLKFQYSLMSSVVYFLYMSKTGEPTSPNFLNRILFLNIMGVSLPVTHLIGGFAVLHVFKKNHPLKKPEAAQTLEDNNDSVAKDFQEQNEAIASKLLEYDEKLNTRGYFAFRWYLKFVIIFEAFRASLSLYDMVLNLITWVDPKAALFIALSLFSFSLSGWCALQTEVALTVKALKNVERAISLLKVCLILSILSVTMYIRNVGTLTSLRGYISLFCSLDMNSFALPILTLIGALKAKKIIQERNIFAPVLTFNDEVYL